MNRRLESYETFDTTLCRLNREIYTAVNADAAKAALDELAAKWGERYPALIRLWENAWEEFIHP